MKQLEKQVLDGCQFKSTAMEINKIEVSYQNKRIWPKV